MLKSGAQHQAHWLTGTDRPGLRSWNEGNSQPQTRRPRKQANGASAPGQAWPSLWDPAGWPVAPAHRPHPLTLPPEGNTPRRKIPTASPGGPSAPGEPMGPGSPGQCVSGGGGHSRPGPVSPGPERVSLLPLNAFPGEGTPHRPPVPTLTWKDRPPVWYPWAPPLPPAGPEKAGGRPSARTHS